MTLFICSNNRHITIETIGARLPAANPARDTTVAGTGAPALLPDNKVGHNSCTNNRSAAVVHNGHTTQSYNNRLSIQMSWGICLIGKECPRGLADVAGPIRHNWLEGARARARGFFNLLKVKIPVYRPRSLPSSLPLVILFLPKLHLHLQLHVAHSRDRSRSWRILTLILITTFWTTRQAGGCKYHTCWLFYGVYLYV